MKPRPFLVGDKVMLNGKCASLVSTVPKLVPGRVYCVERVNVEHGASFLRLVGVRENRKQCLTDRGPFSGAFVLVGEQGPAEVRQPAERESDIIEVPLFEMMSDARWLELATMQKDATELVRQGRDDEALALLTRVLEHDDPRVWMEGIRESVASERRPKRKGEL